MRMSVVKDDPGYHKRAYRYQPYLNGTPIDHCFTADEDRGALWIHKTDSKGGLILNDFKTEILTEQLFGKVEIRLEKGATK